MINPLKLAQSLTGDAVKLHSVIFFSDFVNVDFSLPGIDQVFTSDGNTLEEAINTALNLKADVETGKILASKYWQA